MKLKLDENLGLQEAELFRDAGLDVSTVGLQKLTSAPDRVVSRRCVEEDRCLVSLDLDFANPILFPPKDYAGIAVLRMPSQITREDLKAACLTLIEALRLDDITGKLWIVQRGRIREYQDPNS